jgi:hypothetical protein
MRRRHYRRLREYFQEEIPIETRFFPERYRFCDRLHVQTEQSGDDPVLNVYQGPEGILAYANPATVVIEMSTVSPDTSRVLHRMGRERGIEVLDVPRFVIGQARDDYI